MRRKWKVWLIAVIVVLILGGITFVTVRFISSSWEDQENKKKDNEAPILELKDVTIEKGKTYSIYDFVSSCTDNKSEDCDIVFTSEEMTNFTEIGTYDITVKATDESGNETVKTAKLTIQEVGVTKEENTTEEPSTESSETSSISTEETPHEIKELPPLETPKQDIVMETGVTKEERTETRNLYGTSCNYLITTYYDVLSDGSKKETGTSEKFIDCDYSGFNPNSEEFELEAASSAKTYLYYLANVIVYVNQKRTELGLPDLELNDNLLAASSIRALEMGYSNKFSTQRPHTSQNILDENSIPYIEAKEFVFKDISEPAIIAQNLFSNRDALSSIQNTDYDSIGVGLALVHDHYYWSIYLANLS